MVPPTKSYYYLGKFGGGRLVKFMNPCLVRISARTRKKETSNCHVSDGNGGGLGMIFDTSNAMPGQDY